MAVRRCPEPGAGGPGDFENPGEGSGQSAASGGKPDRRILSGLFAALADLAGVLGLAAAA